MLKLDFTNEVDENIDAAFFDKIVANFYEILKQRVDEYLHGQNGLIDFVLVGDKKMQELNMEYRNKDESTDVLSFAYLEGTEPRKFEADVIVGDIFISSEIAKKQASEHNHSLEKELEILFIHGMLHLFGFDHNTDSEEEEMESWSKKVLKGL